MNKLTQLLDESYPLNGDVPSKDKTILQLLRNAFTEGYNARIAEENTPAPGDPKYDLKKVLEECRKLIVDGRPIADLRLYKETMGSSLTEAKAVLNL